MDAPRLVIDPDRVPSGRLVFRPKHYFGVLLVRRSLVEALEAAGFSGVGSRDLPDREPPRHTGKRRK